MTCKEEIESLEKRMQDLQGELSQISDKIAELKQPKKWPQKGDQYYCNGGQGITFSPNWDNDMNDIRALSVGNVFRTEQEAQDHVDYLKARKQLTDAIAEANEGWEPDWSKFYDTKCQFWFNHEKCKLEIDGKGISQYTPDYFCVKSYDAAKEVLSKLPHDIIKLAITGKK